jgi:hypothetical protein
VTDWFELRVTVQLPVPVQAPDQPENVEPVAGVAVSVTIVPAAKVRQPEPQEVPGGEEVTVPVPVPDVVMVRVVRVGVPDCTVIKAPEGVVAPPYVQLTALSPFAAAAGIVMFNWYSPGKPVNPAKVKAATFPPTWHTGSTGRDPD